MIRDMSLLLALIVCCLWLQPVLSMYGVKAVSVFRNDEIVYHKYSAILAAAEPFRLQLESEIKSVLNPFAYFLRRLQGSSAKPLSDLRFESAEIDSACERYERQVDDIVRSYGLSTKQFNSLSEKIIEDQHLKQRVLLQAFYYRIAADLENNIRRELPVLPSVSTSGRILKFTPVETEKSYQTKSSESSITRFCKTLRLIEYERLRQREHLQNVLGIKVLPERMCDPDIFPAMTKEIQQACVDFNTLAKTLVSKHGFSAEEFTAMQEKMSTTGLFRMRVDRELKRLEQQAKILAKETELD